jgi:hypothetical protein
LNTTKPLKVWVRVTVTGADGLPYRLNEVVVPGHHEISIERLTLGQAALCAEGIVGQKATATICIEMEAVDGEAATVAGPGGICAGSPS